MKKKLFLLVIGIVIIVIVSFLGGYQLAKVKKNAVINNPDDAKVFIAQIENINNHQLLVRAFAQINNYSGLFTLNISDKTQITAQNEKILFSELLPKAIILVTFNSEIKETYPYQIDDVAQIEVLDNPLNPQEDIQMTIKEGTLTNKGATVVITDHTQNDNNYGLSFYLEKEEDGNWVELTPSTPLKFNAIAYRLNENRQVEIKQDWFDFYGALSPGHYRLVKSSAIYPLYAEFVIE